MIGYVQSMSDVDLLKEVNGHAKARTIPSLSKAATAWAAKTVTQLGQDPLARDFDPTPIQLHHLWLDLRQMTFTLAPPKPKAVNRKRRRANANTSSKKTSKK